MNYASNDVRVENTNSESLLSKCSLVEQGTGTRVTIFVGRHLRVSYTSSEVAVVAR